jgi:hypothetical protein
VLSKEGNQQAFKCLPFHLLEYPYSNCRQCWVGYLEDFSGDLKRTVRILKNHSHQEIPKLFLLSVAKINKLSVTS